MKLYDIIMAADADTSIKVRIKLYGAKFETTHYAEWFLKNDDLMERRIVDLRISQNTLILDLE